jgi:Zn-finger nucleic acid-binding protein
MKCPACHAKRLAPVHLADHLNAFQCENCNGHWIPNSSYLSWIDHKGGIGKETPYAEIDLDLEDSTQAKLCPGCGRILLKFQVGHGLDFYVEHCPGCGGVWLDEHEWNALEARNLHDEIHRIFSTTWQNQIREDQFRATIETAYRKRFGDDTFQRIHDFREWLRRHPRKSELLAYLREE